MGAWGAGSFENDSALDWLDDLADADIEEFMAAFEDVMDSPSLDASLSTATIAAAEIVAAVFGRPCDELPDEAKALAQRFEGLEPSIKQRARDAVARVLRRSELRELWEESDSFAEWNASVRDLRARLR